LTDNDYLALVQVHTQPGNEIWIIPGTTTSFVIRRRANGGHELIGEAYVHGIMYGEVASSLEYDTVELK